MHIKEIELRNFKSFGKKIQIPLERDFIVVTGPNGSGKSNIVDALLFALCLSNSRAMRAERLPDLVYKGENGRNPDFAEVTVRLDNQSRTMPIDSDQIEITRKIKINNEKYHALYYFNGKSCTQGEIQDHLARAGITPEGYNVVMQGDVTRIIEMTPVERRKIIDEIAGVAEFDEKKKKSMMELDVVWERIGRVDVILQEVDAQRAKLRVERDKALSYQAHREEKRRQEGFLRLSKMNEAKKELNELSDEVESITVEKEALTGTLTTQKVDLAQVEESFSNLGTKIDHKGGEEQIEVKRRIEEIKGEIARQKGSAEIFGREKSKIEASLKSGYLETDRVKSEINLLDDKLRNAEIRRASLQGEADDVALEAQEARQSIAQADTRFTELKDRLSTQLQDLEGKKSLMGDLVRERDRLLDFVRRFSLEKEDIQTQIKEATDAIDSASTEAKGIHADLDQLNRRAIELERNRSDLERTRMQLRRDIAELDRTLQRLQGEYARSEAQIRAAEERSGYSRAVEAVRSAMRRGLLQGLYGTIADLGEVNQKYSTALEIAAGARLQGIVADSDDDAAVAIDHLKRSQIGRATFLPLNKMQTGSLPNLPNEPGVVDFALKLVRFDPKFYPAFYYVFRDTLVVEDLNSARRMMGRYRMVTLDGDLVEKTGAMTGGHYKSRLRFAADESKRLVELSERVATSDAERSSYLERLDETEQAISSATRQIEELDKEITKKTLRLEDCLSAKPKMEKTIAEKQERLAQIESEGSTTGQRLAGLDEETKVTFESIQAAEAEKREIESQMTGSCIPELTIKAKKAEDEARSLESRVKEIEVEIQKDRLKHQSLTEKIDELSRQKESLETDLQDADLKRKNALDAASKLASELKGMANREKEIEAELQGLKGVRGELAQRMMALQRQVESGNRQLDRLESRLMSSTYAKDEMSRQVEALSMEIEACGVDISMTPPASETVNQKIIALERAMEELEPVNMLAIEEFDHVSKRYEFLDVRRETLNREREEIIGKLERYDQMKKEAFLKTYQEINDNFGEIFKDLSGGEGHLILENSDDPLGGGMTIRAKPAGKVFHRLEAMSGGEKSLTALSFIFAIQRFRPAPFYAMDEIDMFLDGANAEKVARLIKKISRDAQFIVVSLRRPMILQAKYTVGVAMQEKNISTVTGICMN